MEDAAVQYERAAAEVLALLAAGEAELAAALEGMWSRLEQKVGALAAGACIGAGVGRTTRRRVRRMVDGVFVATALGMVGGFDEALQLAGGLLKQLELPERPSRHVIEALATRRREAEREVVRLGGEMTGAVLATMTELESGRRNRAWGDGRLRALFAAWREAAGEGILDGRVAHFRALLLAMGEGARRVHFLYAGPRGEGSRPFCAFRAGRVFDLGEVGAWERMVWSGRTTARRGAAWCGGRNCRHLLLPVAGAGIDPGRFVSRIGRRMAPVGEGASPPVGGGGCWDPATGVGRWHDAAFGHALEYLRRAVGRAGEPAGGVCNTPGESAMMFVLSRGVPRIEMGELRYGERLLRLEKLVWRHEFGHYIDYFINNFENEPCSFRDEGLVRGMNRDGHLLRLRAGLGGSVAFRRRISLVTNRSLNRWLNRLERVGMGERRGWLDRAFRRFGLTLQQVEGALRTDTVYGGFEAEQGRLLSLLVALERRDALLLGEHVLEWRRGWNQERGMVLIVSDFFAAMTGQAVGRGHGEGYYQHHPARRGSELFANGVAMLGDRNLFWTRVLLRFAPGFTTRLIGILKGMG